MSSVGRVSFNQISRLNCSCIYHPRDKSCIKGYLNMLCSSMIGSGKFYLLVFSAQHILNKKEVTLNYIKDILQKYICETAFGGFMGAGFVGSACFLRHILRRYYYYTFSMLPASVGGIAIFLVHPVRRDFAVTTFQYLALETMYSYLQAKGIFKKTVFFDTIFFMICSSGLLYLIRSRKNCNTFLWFFTPRCVEQPTKGKTNCTYTASWKNILNLSKKYFLFGFILEAVRKVFVALRTDKNLNSLMLRLFSIDTYLLGLFAGSYVLVYEVVVHYLCQWFKYDAAVFALPAGFIAGATYCINPNLTISAIALSNLLKIALEYMNEKLRLPSFPWKEISFIINSGLLFHFRVMHPQLCAKNAVSVMNTMTNGRANEIYRTFNNYIVAAAVS